MKDIIVCIDGTSNAGEVSPGVVSFPNPITFVHNQWRRLRGAPPPVQTDRQLPSNVLLLARALAARNSADQPQVVEYVRGVGTDESAGPVGRTFAAMGGRGLSQIVQDAYVFLTNNYEASDHVYLIGFSRGAAAARSLSGLTELFGVLPKHLMDQFPDAWEYYNGTDRNLKILAQKSPILAAIAEQGERLRRDHAYECADYWGAPQGGLGSFPHAPAFLSSRERGSLRTEDDPDEQYVPMPLHFVGVWDTVFEASKEGYHEGRLAWNVGTAYQALALHEVRPHFQPELWTLSCRHQQVIQSWFTGAHSDVGGGNGNLGLSSIALEWMIRRARDSSRFHRGPCLRFSRGFVSRVLLPDVCAEVSYPQESKTWRAAGKVYAPLARAIGMLERKPGVPLEFRHDTVELRDSSGRPSYHPEWEGLLRTADERAQQSLFPESDGDALALLVHLQNSGITDPDVAFLLALLTDIDSIQAAEDAGASGAVTLDDLVRRYPDLSSTTC